MKDALVPLKLHLGCGDNILRGWENIDHPKSRTKQVANRKMDITNREHWEHYEDKIVEYIYTEHTIEHLEYKDAKVMLEESYKTLKSGGAIRIATPDLCFLTELMNEDKTEVQEEYIDYSVSNIAYNVDIPFESVIINNFLTDWGHKFIYDYKLLSHLLKEVGFNEIKECEIGISDIEDFSKLENKQKRVKRKLYELETFVVEAKKL
tara:strand:- start:338 stop:958 length:621 start_codon:yes stop_codon:yes gene_type:complete